MSDAVETVCSYSTREHVVQAFFLAGVGLGLGGLVGYKYAERTLSLRYQELLDQEIRDTKEFYARLHKGPGYETPEEAAASLGADDEATMTEAVDALHRYQGSWQDDERELVGSPSTPEPEWEHVSDSSDDSVDEGGDVSFVDPTFDIDAEMRLRNDIDPFVVSQEEYFEDDDFTKSALIYYAGDGVLSDERDEPIPIIDQVVGVQNLKRFGHGSGDEDVVYIRNPRMGQDFEIAYHHGKFAHEVAGLEHADGSDRDQRLMIQRHRAKGRHG